MQFEKREFIPVILGGDINTYSVARAFYEEYQVKTTVMGKYPAGPSYGSRIVDYIPNESIDQEETFLKQINEFADEHAHQKVIILGAGDNYINMITKLRDELAQNIIAPFVSHELMDNLQRKDYFYELCEKAGVDYPDTVIVSKETDLNFEVPFSYPVILKSSESIHYWDYPFLEQEKVFTIDNREELNEMITKIREAGYPEPLIIQDMIPGNDEYMYVLTSYSNQQGKVTMMCLGHVLLEEHTPLGKGNHAVIVTDYNKELMEQARTFLESIDYVGFSNFDIKYDQRDGKYKFFEINTRQGRSNYYVTGSGFNIARYLVDDYIYNKDQTLEVATEPHLWWVIPKMVAFQYIQLQENIDTMKELIKENKVVNPLFLRSDLPSGRFLRLTKNYFSHFVKFNKYYQQ
jgi:D-aspartate ligase